MTTTNRAEMPKKGRPLEGALGGAGHATDGERRSEGWRANLLANVPPELRRRDQRVAWREEIPRGGKRPTKVPYAPRLKRRASSTDRHTWCSFEDAAKAVTDYNGVGFVVSEDDPIVGIDLDHCRNPETGVIPPEALEIVRALATYDEISPSGCGLRMFCFGSLPTGGRKKDWVEVYERARYFTVTGDALADSPLALAERTDELART